MATPNLAADFPDSVSLGLRLREAKLTIAVAESCTGGLLGAVLTAVPGSSDYMRGGVIAYANDIKSALLDVDPGVLATHGAISAEVAVEMAAGARSGCGSDIGVSITGVAGPDADGSAKPVGLIFVAVADQEGVDVVRLDEAGDREANRAAAVRAAIAAVLSRLDRRSGRAAM